MIECLNLAAGSWTTLLTEFAALGTQDSTIPAKTTHGRARGDGDAILYESLFDPAEVSPGTFKALLAAELEVSIGAILCTSEIVSYDSGETLIWKFYYDEVTEGEDQIQVEWFGCGKPWGGSGDECRAYLSLYSAQW